MTHVEDTLKFVLTTDLTPNHLYFIILLLFATFKSVVGMFIVQKEARCIRNRPLKYCRSNVHFYKIYKKQTWKTLFGYDCS